MKRGYFYHKAVVRTGKKTKLLCQEIKPGEIALISHQDLDETAAKDLLYRDVKVVINAKCFFSGAYPHKGPQLLLEKGVFLLENVGESILPLLQSGDLLEIRENVLFKNQKEIAKGNRLDIDVFQKKYAQAEKRLEYQLDNFVKNTLQYARLEAKIILGDIKLPEIKLNLNGKHVVIVVRGKNYREDFEAIIPYIKERSPVIIGVDGGADLIREKGFTPDLIIGDMDSVTNCSLKNAGEIVVHAYPDGKSPGRCRLAQLGIPHVLFPAPGTSEDIALLLAYEKQAKLIVAVGTHSHMIDFLEKGRKGMGSTFLVRLKVGSRLVDAKGVSQLYQSTIKWPLISALIIAALLPLTILLIMSPILQHFLKIIWLRFQYGLL